MPDDYSWYLAVRIVLRNDMLSMFLYLRAAHARVLVHHVK